MTREIAQRGKKLLETKKVARNTRSCQKVAEQLVENPNPGTSANMRGSPKGSLKLSLEHGLSTLYLLKL